MSKIDELRELRAKATQGRWAIGEYGDEVVCPDTDIPDAIRILCQRDGEENAPFIVAAVNALDALLDVAEAARADFPQIDCDCDACHYGDSGSECRPRIAWHKNLRSALAALEVDGE